MRRRQEHNQQLRSVANAWLAAVVGGLLIMAPQLMAGERQFLVILATSPKQYPGPDRGSDANPLGQPNGGLINPQAIFNQYFDTTNPAINSFAEYWDEVSYGDVKISGDAVGWIELPWAIQPPLIDAARDGAGTGPPVGDNLADPTLRNSPSNFFDLNQTGLYEYGEGERFLGSLAQSIIDKDGNPGTNDNGPFVPGSGSSHLTSTGLPVWKPGERFVDMDGDGRWDGLDETNNTMDWNGDGRPDNRMPWIDLNNNGAPDNPANCVVYPDSDNDGNPDCCPDGPGTQGCEAFPDPGSCPPGKWTGPSGDINDCNGNLIPDSCDVNCFSAECRATGWREIPGNASLCGDSEDRLPIVEGAGGFCDGVTPDGIPDECQFDEADGTTCIESEVTDPDDPCNGKTVCRAFLFPLADAQLVDRCEYDDSNNSSSLDMVEPFENFLRRWNPDVFDIEAASPNREDVRAHWIKVYDPASPVADLVQLNPDGRSFSYGDDAYIRNNYPGRGRFCDKGRASCKVDADCPPGSTCIDGVEELVKEAGTRAVYGQHDPRELLTECICWDSTNCPTGLLADGTCPCPTDLVAGACPCSSVRLPDGSMLENACVAGFHVEFNPPDSWTNATAPNAPGGTTLFTTKMRSRPSLGGSSGRLDTRTPLPGSSIQAGDDDWYEDAWRDRYNALACFNPEFFSVDSDPTTPLFIPCKCENENFDPSLTADENNPRTIACEAPPWPADDRIEPYEPFPDVDTGTYDPLVNRRFFQANAGGRNGDGTGWIGCDTGLDAGIAFELGQLNNGFEQLCDARILPEEVNGASSAGIFYDGWVEHDDLPSSKYHRAGDQRLGEVTSPSTQDIWGQDRGIGVPSGSGPDFILRAAGPYATDIHGNNGRDAGNLLTMELLTWRTEPPFNNGFAWETDLEEYGISRSHPYAGMFPGANMGFRDYNLDGLVDQGECRHPGSENYQADSVVGSPNNGVDSFYPFNRDRLIEDCIEVIDRKIDFDDFVDPVTMARLTCGSRGGALGSFVPPQFLDPDSPIEDNIIFADGVLSGIVLLPAGGHAPGDFNRAPGYIPIHNEDNDNPDKVLPNSAGRTSWNLFFQNLLISLGAPAEGRSIPTGGFQTAFAAHEYLHTWEGFPDLYDYDVYAPVPKPQENCPIGAWGIMANGGLVHPVPILKEESCTEWIKPVDLTTVLTPGVPKTLTLPPAEFVRDDSYFFLENEERPGERYYFWSAGSGFDLRMPGAGMLIMHTNLDDANPEALPTQQTSAPFQYEIIEADGLDELFSCRESTDNSVDDRGDTGDVWPGSSGAFRFSFDTLPAARWDTQNRWTGIDITDITPDGFGSIALRISWVPTNIPSLQFLNPPNSESVNSNFQVNFRATDVFGGTTIGLYYAKDEKRCIGVSGAGALCSKADDCPADTHCDPVPSFNNLIGTTQKTTPGTGELSMSWDVSSVADGRYVLFAALTPGAGADGFERSFTTPRGGRNNVGNGSLAVISVNVANVARSEAWIVELVDATNQLWRVNSTLTQPVLDVNNPNPSLYPQATTGTLHKSINEEVQFTITQGTTPFIVGDSFSFVTTGVTAASQAVTIENGEVTLNPVADFTLTPSSGDPPLDVSFDARSSFDPNGAPLDFTWDFGDGTPGAAGPVVAHRFEQPGLFTIVLRATNPSNGRFGEFSRNVSVTNNSPRAAFTVSRGSGLAPLEISFDAGQSTDGETPASDLIYRWDFGDGRTANDALAPGIAFQTTTHTYTADASGTPCTRTNPCEFLATLTVEDTGGAKDTATRSIRVGNSDPVAVVSSTRLQGSIPFEVVFNAINSFDPDGDTLTVDWNWGDGQTSLGLPLTGEAGATDGSVRHTYNAANVYSVTATVRDTFNGEAVFGPVTVTVSEAAAGSSDPRARFNRCTALPCLTNDRDVPILGELFFVDATDSRDQPPSGTISAYTWEWGDGSANDSGKTASHTYPTAGTFTIRLTVFDNETPRNSGSRQATVIVADTGGNDPGDNPDNLPPVPVFVVDPSSGFAGSTSTLFAFNARASVDPDGDEAALRFDWMFGDGATAINAGPEVSHRYATAKSDGYVVRLTVRDEANASRSTTRTVIVLDSAGNRAPNAFIGSGPRAGTAPFSPSLNATNSFDLDGDELAYRWAITRDGQPFDEVFGETIAPTFDLPGTYQVEVWVSDGQGGEGHAGPVTIVVTARGPVLVDPGAGQDVPDNSLGDIRDSADQRPSSLCGLGMSMTVFASLMGLVSMMISRRRRRV